MKLIPAKILFILLFFSIGLSVNAGSLSENTSDLEGDSCLIVLEEAHFKKLDSLAALLNYAGDLSIPEEQWINIDIEQISLSDSVIEERLSLIPTTIPLSYNRIVKNCVELFVVKNRKHTARMRGLSSRYFGFFESELEKRGLPHELKYLAVIESAFNPQAVSKAGATGLWQLMFATGKWLGLKIDTYVDERRDPVKSTEVALDYLSSLYKIYDDWLLAIAAYNSGPGNVNKAIRRAGGLKNFWAIKSYLPRETQSYVPLFIGASYALHYAEDYGIPAINPAFPYLATDTVIVHKKRSLEYVAHCMGTDAELLSQCNPALKLKVIPKTIHGTTIHLPSHLLSQYILVEDRIMSDSLYSVFSGERIVKNKRTVTVPNVSKADNRSDYIIYSVRSGDNLGFIAERFDVGLSDLKRWNGIRGSRIKIGQKLRIYGAKKETSASRVISSSTSHKVRSGETLGIIAQRYGVSLSSLKEMNGLNGNTIYIGQMLKLKESKSATSTTNSSNIHVVRSGDSLWEIAMANKMTVSELCSLNGLSTRSTLQPGQKLKVR